MKHLIYIFSTISILFSSCIENDVPYPVVAINIESIIGEGFTTKSIDVVDRVVILSLDEITDISKVDITEIKITEGGGSLQPLSGIFDLSSPMSIMLSMYQDYQWTIRAEQYIVREFIVEGQIGASEFDVATKTAKAYVYQGTDRTNIKVEELKLGAESTTLTSTNFESPVYVDVKVNQSIEKWTLLVEYTESAVELTKNDVWTSVAWLEAAGDNRTELGFKYRADGAQEWETILKGELTIHGGQFSAKITNLIPSKRYEFVAFSDGIQTPIYEATTDPATPLINGGFENWSKPAKAWFPFANEGDKYWNSGNKGATTISENDNTTTPVDDPRPGSTGKKSAQLKSKYIIIKFAGGSLFVGDYIGTRGLNGIIGLGQPFTERPTAFKFWIKYKGGKINYIEDARPPGVEIIKDVTDDECEIYMALGTWTPEEYGVSSKEPEMVGTEQTPIIVDTRDPSTFFDPTSPAVIAYGKFAATEDIEQWREVTVPLNYTTTSLAPTHLVIVCATSKYADYFIGCDKSTLHIDDIELIYGE